KCVSSGYTVWQASQAMPVWRAKLGTASAAGAVSTESTSVTPHSACVFLTPLFMMPSRVGLPTRGSLAGLRVSGIAEYRYAIAESPYEVTLVWKLPGRGFAGFSTPLRFLDPHLAPAIHGHQLARKEVAGTPGVSGRALQLHAGEA